MADVSIKTHDDVYSHIDQREGGCTKKKLSPTSLAHKSAYCLGVVGFTHALVTKCLRALNKLTRKNNITRSKPIS